MNKNITKKQMQILMLVYKFRFMSSAQIQIVLKCKRRQSINYYLLDLTKKGYLKRKANIKDAKPTIYFIGKKGIWYLKQIGVEKTKLKKLYADESKGNEFIDQKLSIADLYIELTQKIKEPDKNIVFFETQPETSVTNISPSLAPKATFLLTNSITNLLRSNTKPNSSFLEFLYIYDNFQYYIPRFVQRKKVLEFEKAILNIQKKTNNISVLLVLPTNSNRKYLKKFIKSNVSETKANWLLTTAKEYNRFGITSRIWQRI